jgi:hypothetical protein
MSGIQEWEIREQLRITKRSLLPEALVQDGLIQTTLLIEMFFNYMEKSFMDKKMHQVTKRIETAERDIKKGKGKEAEKVLSKAAKKNEKLVKIDRDVRDPLIDKCKKDMKKAKKK